MKSNKWLNWVMRHPIPSDLARTQHEWTATYRVLAARQGGTALRRRLLRLSVALYYHPFWSPRGRFPVAEERRVDLTREEEVGS